LYAHAIIRGSVDGHKGWLIVSGLLLGVLTQLHFSYFLLVPAHIALAVFGNLRAAFLKTLCIVAVFVPLIPYLVVEAMQDFPNTRQIMTMPRFHPEYVLSSPLANTNVLVLTLEWLRQFPGLLAEPISRFVVGMVGVGIASAIFAAAGRADGPARMTLPAAAAALFCFPLLGLTLMGMGYGSRHTISILPGMFLLAGIGFGTATRLLLGSWERASAVIVLLLLATFGWRIMDNDRIAAVTRQQGEWAVDYRQRETIADDLITRLGITPEIYLARVFWWWLGWSMAPEIFGDLYRKRRGEGRLPSGAIAPDDYILITDRDPPPFLKNAFELMDTRPVGGMYVHQAKAAEKFSQPLPSSNADTGTRLRPFLRAVDRLRPRQAGFGRIGQQQDGAVQRELFLGNLAEGRLKILVTTEEEQIDNRSRLRWCVDSPSLNGHYQEIKTVWRPRLLLESATGTTPVSLARDVLGSLLYKTPQCGEAWSEKSGSQSIAFAADGIFDQSFMLRPDVSARTWKLGELPPDVHALDRGAVSNWMTTRFKPDRLPE
jgi:hypothetical protein